MRSADLSAKSGAFYKLNLASRTEMVWDDTMEPTAADHGDVLYNIGKHPMIGRFMEARRDIHPGEVGTWQHLNPLTPKTNVV